MCVRVCFVSDGAVLLWGLSACVTVVKKGQYPAGLAINGGYLYIAYFDSNNVYKCLLTTLSFPPQT